MKDRVLGQRGDFDKFLNASEHQENKMAVFTLGHFMEIKY